MSSRKMIHCYGKNLIHANSFLPKISLLEFLKLILCFLNLLVEIVLLNAFCVLSDLLIFIEIELNILDKHLCHLKSRQFLFMDKFILHRLRLCFIFCCILKAIYHFIDIEFKVKFIKINLYLKTKLCALSIFS